MENLARALDVTVSNLSLSAKGFLMTKLSQNLLYLLIKHVIAEEHHWLGGGEGV